MSSRNSKIRDAVPSDANAIADIYNHYIRTSISTFEEEVLSGETFEKRIADVQKSFPWLIYENSGEIVGYAYASAWKARSAYSRTAESSVYIRDGHHGKGIGKALYTEIIKWLKVNDYHSVLGGISLPNSASVALHERMGYEKVAHLKEVGFKFGKWIDVGYWQKML